MVETYYGEPPALPSAVEAYRVTLGELRELNGLFLELIRRMSARPGADQPFGLPRQVTGRIAALVGGRGADLASCPYALFSLGAADREFWLNVAEPVLPESDAELEALRAESLSLSVAALGCAWQLCRGHGRLAALAFGLPASVLAALARTPLAFLHRVVAHNPTVVTARLAEHPCFWGDLLAAVERGSAAQVAAARLAGLHLIAAAALAQH